jgi:hypothetical protein
MATRGEAFLTGWHLNQDLEEVRDEPGRCLETELLVKDQPVHSSDA